MARASTAGAPARAGALRTFGFGRAKPWAYPNLEIIARLSVPVALGAFVALLIGASFAFVQSEQDRAIAAAATDVELVASLIADEVDKLTRPETKLGPTEALARAMPLRGLSHGERVLLTDPTGKVVASYPDPHMSGTITDHLGDRQPLIVFAEKAGVMRLILPGGGEALATVHSLTDPLGQVAIIHPIEDVLSGWRDALYRIAFALTCIGAVLLAFAGAYCWQAARAHRADGICRKMRDRVDLALSRGHCGLWDWDLATGHVDWSLSMYEILGMAPRTKTLSAASINDMIHPEDANLDEALRLLSEDRDAIDHVFRMRNARGEWVWLRARAELVQDEDTGPRLVGIAIDVTEAMELEARSATADLRLRDAIETISEAFVVWDAENRLVMCNSKFQRFYDLPDKAIAAGTPYATVMEYGTPPIVQAQVALRTPQPLGARTFEARLGDGRWLQIDERRTKDGGYVSVGTDVTALKHNEEQLMESERRLMHSVIDLRKSRQDMETQAQVLAELAEKYLEQKAEAEQANRAKSDFLANMSHELRTPLNAILGFSEIMMMESYGTLGSSLYLDYCKDIHASGRYLLAVIADVLEMSRLEAGRVRIERQEFVLEDALRAALGSVSDIATKNAIGIRCDVRPGTNVLADRTAIEKVMTILLNNSVKYTPVQGNVTVRVRTILGGLNIYVEDTGVGMTPEAIARLGRPFEQTDTTLRDGMRGSGLGLAIARSLVDLHGGTMRIRSKPGLGTLVLVRLPQRPLSRPQLLVTSDAARSAPRPARLPAHLSLRSAAKISRTA